MLISVLSLQRLTLHIHFQGEHYHINYFENWIKGKERAQTPRTPLSNSVSFSGSTDLGSEGIKPTIRRPYEAPCLESEAELSFPFPMTRTGGNEIQVKLHEHPPCLRNPSRCFRTHEEKHRPCLELLNPCQKVKVPSEAQRNAAILLLLSRLPDKHNH